jgi:hypothetical protein
MGLVCVGYSWPWLFSIARVTLGRPFRWGSPRHQNQGIPSFSTGYSRIPWRSSPLPYVDRWRELLKIYWRKERGQLNFLNCDNLCHAFL